MGKYDPLYRRLMSSTEPTLRFTFAEIERILGEELPPSARRHQAWWANEREGTHVHALSWLDAGYKTQRLDVNAGTVEFVRSSARATRER
jgi:hypothetical protein